MILQTVVSFVVSLVETVVIGLFLVPALQRAKAGQSIREDGPVWHNNKQGTPTMGGIMFIGAIALTCLAVGLSEIRLGNYSHLFVLAFALVYGAIGFLDDYQKLKKKQNLGLKAVHKFALQLIVSAGFILLMRKADLLSSNLYIPFVNITIAIPEPIYYIFVAFVAVGTVNSVNITDGVDGLVSGVSIPVSIFFAVIALLWRYTAIGLFAAALAGGLAAFLYFNFHPAKVFMGDTGSLFLGGAICAMALALDMPLILIPLGIIYFIETLSDIIQVAYFKLTKGKRVFKMAPIHHHFEMCGWSERKLFFVFTTISAIFAVISYFGVFQRHN